MKTLKIKTAIIASFWLSVFSLQAQTTHQIYRIEGAFFDTTKNSYIWTAPMFITMGMKINEKEVFIFDQANTHLSLDSNYTPISKTDEKGVKYTKYIWAATDESKTKCQFNKIISESTTDTIYLLLYRDYAIRYYIKKQ